MSGTNGLLVRALAEHARNAPQRVALVARGEQLTYGQLFTAARRVAVRLHEHGAGPGARVAVLGEKTAAAVVSVLGTLLAGAAYVPLDPSAPQARRRSLVADAGARLLLAADPGKAGELGEDVRVLDPWADADADAWRAPELGPEDFAYVLYTSGSTGRPKGVCVPHRAVDAFFGAVAGLMDLGPGARCLNTSALHFDVSVIDLLFPLHQGATVHLGPAVPLPAPTLQLIARERITHMAAVGSTLTLLAQHGLEPYDLSALRRIMTGAEILNPRTVQAWLAAAPHATVINGYGPTEATCVAIAEPISAREPERTAPYPVGRPLPGVGLGFLGADGEVSADGPGEILLSGPQLMAGYLGRPEEEARAFHEGAYRTGDLGHRDERGIVHFAGRSDDEVKIRGYRINLNEIRATLESHPAVGRAFVTDVEDPRSGRSLACGIQLRQGASAGADELTTYAADALPRYMVPREVVFLDGFPVLSSGKPDTARLRVLVTEGAGR
ncbi:non-ribosomal peptide synthetase [Streptomyces sp. NBRC 110611]|uniref:amino acid adenylation domain-containing protein n=1 Tax=Streptomyces sp. NBRC 110611 TaxID=1621259 RepID=UPI00082A26FC|nr:amino acid adenylation domain-containing protein [Streptomyces sp. NBRC 110611]GAU67363.1 non-ribosomal peptide synthetase [Streptomyces sp. NBRC 110611]